MTAPTPVIPGSQPVSGSTTTLEVAVAYQADGITPVATPVFAQVPVAGEISLTFAPGTTTYDAYVSSGLDAWSYAVKTGMGATLTFRTAAPLSDPVVAPLVEAGLKSGNGAGILFRKKNPDGSYFSGYALIGLDNPTPVRGVAEVSFTGPVSGKVTFTPKAP